jgi:death-on-curing protein
VYLTASEVVAIHGEAVGCSDATALTRLRSHEGLEAAVARPQHHAHYAGADLALQAAVLAHGIAEAQIFIDGNKRTALLTLLTFLGVNGHELHAADDELAGWIIELAAGGTAEHLANRIRHALATRTR